MDNKKKNYNHDRIQQTMLIILCNTLRDEIYDPIVKLATFTNLKLTNDYSEAVILVDTYDRKKIDQVVEAVAKAKGAFKTALAKNLEIRKIPELIFQKDYSINQSLEVERIINQLHKKTDK
ncbi:MAG: 30S ribosome-binding factor RbfA [Mycoplasmoidaceae bacterium]|nr:30S ribosome-binding factor RbfA [Mycoplasmoidaceae bacterium]